MKHIEVYRKASGARVNVRKSEIMCVEKVDIRQCDIPFKVTEDYIKILGVNIGVKRGKRCNMDRSIKQGKTIIIFLEAEGTGT